MTIGCVLSTTITRIRTFDLHLRTAIQPLSNLSALSSLDHRMVPWNVVMISLTVRELSCWQTDRQRKWQTDTTDNNTNPPGLFLIKYQNCTNPFLLIAPSIPLSPSLFPSPFLSFPSFLPLPLSLPFTLYLRVEIAPEVLFSAQNAPQTVWRPSSVRMRWRSLQRSPRPSSWI